MNELSLVILHVAQTLTSCLSGRLEISLPQRGPDFMLTVNSDVILCQPKHCQTETSALYSSSVSPNRYTPASIFHSIVTLFSRHNGDLEDRNLLHIPFYTCKLLIHCKLMSPTEQQWERRKPQFIYFRSKTA